jgi:hypothetical protein
MEYRFGANFADVRIHADEAAGRTSLQLGARAFTQGRHIAFAPGHYQPGTQRGLGLIAHELTHVIHQRSGSAVPFASAARVAPARSRLEDEAEHNERAVANPLAPLRAVERTERAQIQRSPSILDEIRARAFSNIEDLADYLLAHSERARDPRVVQINQLRTEFRGSDVIEFPHEAVADLEAIYQEARSKAPSWLPVPRPDFSSTKSHPTTAAIALTPVVVFIAFLLVMFFLFYMDFLSRAAPTLGKGRTRRKPTGWPDTKPKPETQPKPATPETKPGQPPRQEVEPENTTDPRRKPEGPKPRPRPPVDVRPQPYPICWATQLGPPPQSLFVRTKSERDENEAKQARLALAWRATQDPGFDDKVYHVHHVVPLILGGVDDLKTNATTIPRTIHLRGHNVLRWQPQMANSPHPLPPLPTDLYEHPPGIPYRLVGFKQTKDESCP